MALRTRLAVLTSAAVALSIVAASVAAWLLIRGFLLDEVDRSLMERVPDVDQIAQMTADLPALTGGRMVMSDGRLAVLQDDPLGVQLLGPQGEVTRRATTGDAGVPVDEHERELLEGTAADPGLRTVTIDGESFRMMSATLGEGGVLRLLHPLAGVEATMMRIAWLLAGVAGVGVAMAGGLGWVTARAGLRPVDKLVAAAERVGSTRDLGHRIDVDGDDRDEVARLAASINTMLAALDSARRQQQELVENAGHELRTPLATLRNDLGLLLRAEQHPERRLTAAERAKLLRDLEDETAALADLVSEVLDLARGELEPEPPLETDLRSLIDRAVTRAGRTNPEVGIVTRVDPVEALVRPAALERAISNLARNAVQVSPDGGEVEITADEMDGRIRVEVLDRGPGISAEDTPRLFDRFYRGEGARKRHGSGLGLAIVAQVADLHGGTVDVRNRPGGGAVFTLEFPAADDGG